MPDSAGGFSLGGPEVTTTWENVPLQSRQLMAAGLILALVPNFPHVTPWMLMVYIAATFWGLLLRKRLGKLTENAIRGIVLMGGMIALLLQYGTVIGLEPGMALLLLLVSMKLLETERPRDLHVLLFVGAFLCLTTLFFLQDLLIMLYVVAVLALLVAGVIRMQMGEFALSDTKSGGWRGILRSLRYSSLFLLQALPVLLLLFFFFPRTYGGFRFQFGRSLAGVSGMSDRMEPGIFSSLAMSDKIAFRVEFPDGNAPRLPMLYWRGGVLWSGGGLHWVAGEDLPPPGRLPPLSGEAVRQRIMLNPHGERWLFSLDRPASGIEDATYEAGEYFQSIRPVRSSRLYDVTSRPYSKQQDLQAWLRKAAVDLGRYEPSARVRELVNGLRAEAPDNRQYVESVLRYFRTNRFVYTLNPGTYAGDGLEHFLLRRREGFCEHYAGAFTTMMRMADVPARVVIGYHGGEFNAVGNYLIVRQSDAHAWSEVWLEGEGWVRVDPTTVVAPERISSGFEAFRDSGGGADGSGSGGRSTNILGLRALVREVRLAWDTINFQWNLHVLNFDEEAQRTFFAQLGIMPTVSSLLLYAVALLIPLVALIWWLAVRSSGARVERLRAVYNSLTRKLEAAGMPVPATSGPAEVAREADSFFGLAGEEVRTLLGKYTSFRYGRTEPRASEIAALERSVRRLRIKRPASRK